MPSAFVWPLALIVRDAGWPPTLAYPARGVAAMWTEPPAPPDSLARLLGATRAAILADLANARTTSQLGHRHELAQATVSEHLAALAGAQLLTRRRDRREVRYQRTGLGDRLVRADTDAATQEPSV
jgi:DNA-binding transcriptional ArsR family regulator